MNVSSVSLFYISCTCSGFSRAAATLTLVIGCIHRKVRGLESVAKKRRQRYEMMLTVYKKKGTYELVSKIKIKHIKVVA